VGADVVHVCLDRTRDRHGTRDQRTPACRPR
jgi:hypothetical protein